MTNEKMINTTNTTNTKETEINNYIENLEMVYSDEFTEKIDNFISEIKKNDFKFLTDAQVKYLYHDVVFALLDNDFTDELFEYNETCDYCLIESCSKAIDFLEDYKIHYLEGKERAKEGNYKITEQYYLNEIDVFLSDFYQIYDYLDSGEALFGAWGMRDFMIDFLIPTCDGSEYIENFVECYCTEQSTLENIIEEWTRENDYYYYFDGFNDVVYVDYFALNG